MRQLRSEPPAESRRVTAADPRPGDVGRRIGDFSLRRPLGSGRLGVRWLARRSGQRSAVVLHAVQRAAAGSLGRRGARDGRRFLDAVAPLRALDHPHVLGIFDAVPSEAGWHWLATRYAGSADGLLSLASVAEQKDDGIMETFEAERVLRQLLEASSAAHAAGVAHGEFDISEILVDRFGAIAIELYGVAGALTGSAGPGAARREVRSIVEIGYRLVTGVGPPEPLIAPSRLVRRIGRAWDAWLDEGLAGGFTTPAAALAALPAPSGAASGGPSGTVADGAMPTPVVRRLSWRLRTTADS